MESFGKICCADCEKVIAHFPVDNRPKESIELYCEDCKEGFEKEPGNNEMTKLRIA